MAILTKLATYAHLADLTKYTDQIRVDDNEFIYSLVNTLNLGCVFNINYFNATTNSISLITSLNLGDLGGEPRGFEIADAGSDKYVFIMLSNAMTVYLFDGVDLTLIDSVATVETTITCKITVDSSSAPTTWSIFCGRFYNSYSYPSGISAITKYSFDGANLVLVDENTTFASSVRITQIVYDDPNLLTLLVDNSSSLAFLRKYDSSLVDASLDYNLNTVSTPDFDLDRLVPDFCVDDSIIYYAGDDLRSFTFSAGAGFILSGGPVSATSPVISNSANIFTNNEFESSSASILTFDKLSLSASDINAGFSATTMAASQDNRYIFTLEGTSASWVSLNVYSLFSAAPLSGGHIGAFFLGTVDASGTPDLQDLSFEVIEPDIFALSRTDQIVYVTPPYILYQSILPVLANFSDVDISFVGVPKAGSSPLVVDFTATVKFNGRLSGNYGVSKYIWYFDYDNNPTIYEETTTPEITHVYNGYYGKKFSVKLKIEIKRI